MLKNKLLQIKNISVYIPTNLKTDIEGFWIDNKGNLHKDNIIIQKVNYINYQRIKFLLFERNELAIFYTQNDNAYIETKEGLKILKTKEIFSTSTISNAFIKALCKEYNGCTVYKKNEGYLVETWSK